MYVVAHRVLAVRAIFTVHFPECLDQFRQMRTAADWRPPTSRRTVSRMAMENWQIFRSLDSGSGGKPVGRLLIAAGRAVSLLMQTSVATQCPGSHNHRLQQANGEIPDTRRRTSGGIRWCAQNACDRAPSGDKSQECAAPRSGWRPLRRVAREILYATLRRTARIALRAHARLHLACAFVALRHPSRHCGPQK